MHRLVTAVQTHAPKFAPELAIAAYRLGLAVTGPDGTTRPIPVTATPIVIDSQELGRRAHLTQVLASAALKMARATLHGPDREILLGALSPLERDIAERTFRRVDRLVTARIDYFVADRPWALEINATIPAMQGYSDIAARAFIETVGRHVKLPRERIERLVSQNGSNARALLDALWRGFALERARQRKPLDRPRRIALLCRRNDAQLTEQRYLCERFRSFGQDADVVHPDELAGETEVSARGHTYDLIYRHLFVRRLEEMDAPYVRALFAEAGGDRVVLLNPPASQIEVKTTFALLSQAVTDAALAKTAGLTDEERAAAKSAIPWTRPFGAGGTVGPDGDRVPDLVKLVAAAPKRFVLKRAWDYGGKAVFVGSSAGEESFDERVRAAYGAPLSWAELCERAASDKMGGGFVVQELVPTEPERHVLCTEAGTEDTSLFVDYSMYASVGLDNAPRWGGVVRGSISRIVNIVGGGGVLPLVSNEVADELASALPAGG